MLRIRALVPILLAGLAVPVVAAWAEQTFPESDWQEEPSPIASPYAVPGGEIAIFAGQSPKSLNYYLDNNTFTAQVFGSLYETMLGYDPISLDREPALARRWTISDDKKTFTFHLDPRAKWSDGTPLTAEDVAWTFHAIMKPENRTGVHKVSLETFDDPEIVDARTIRFTAREVHWRNLGALGGMNILPKHAFEDLDFNKINFEFPVVSGPYALGELKEGIYLTLTRRDDWWYRASPASRGTANFATLKFRFYGERENAFEAFRKGQIDLFPVYTSRRWVKETDGEDFQNNWIMKQLVENHNPVGFQGFAMNMRRPPFNDVRVRKAMCHLLDRRKMNARLMYNQYFLHKSYFEDLYGPDNPCPNELIEFDKDRARDLLTEAGWEANPDTGLLEKDGRTFRFRFLTRSATADKFLAIYAEDLKDVGIEMDIDRKDWAAWAKDMETFNYEMTWASWASGVFKDPEGMWASSEAKREGGNNITGFMDDRVDELIDRQRGLFDVAARNEICRTIDQIVYDEHPYALLWNINATRLLYWNKFGMPDTVLSKYGDERSAYTYWWYDADADAALRSAMDAGRALPDKPPVVDFDEHFTAQTAAWDASNAAEETGQTADAGTAPDDADAEAPEASSTPATRWVAVVLALAGVGAVLVLLRRKS